MEPIDFLTYKDVKTCINYNVLTIETIKKFLEEDCLRSRDDVKFNIFLSHAYRDARLIYIVREYFERRGFRTYVDWINDRELDRTQVVPDTARRIKQRMLQSDCLVFLASEYSKESKWVSWEIGYFDAKIGKIAILPIANYSDDVDEIIYRQEYLGLYPLISKAKFDDSNYSIIVNDPYDESVSFDIKDWFHQKLK